MKKTETTKPAIETKPPQPAPQPEKQKKPSKKRIFKITTFHH